MWAPEREITVDEARDAVCSTTYPGPVDLIEIIGAGWDNTIVLVDGDQVFRFPRREMALPGIRHEIDHLPRLAPRLPLPVPVPSYVGTAGDPAWPFWGAPHLPGVELAQSPDLDRVPVAAGVGAFLAELHALPVVEGLPVDPMGRGDAAIRVDRAREALDDLRRAGLWSGDPALEAIMDASSVLGPCLAAPVLSHGDLYARHVLVSDGAASGIIDWGDMCLAAAAVDLSIAYSAFRGAARSALLEAYGPVDDEMLLRARTLAVSIAGSVALYAHDIGDEVLLAEMLTGLAGIA